MACQLEFTGNPDWGWGVRHMVTASRRNAKPAGIPGNTPKWEVSYPRALSLGSTSDVYRRVVGDRCLDFRKPTPLPDRHMVGVARDPID